MRVPDATEVQLLHHARQQYADQQVLEHAVRILSICLDDLLDIVKTRPLTHQEYARARAYLPPGTRNAYPPKLR